MSFIRKAIKIIQEKGVFIFFKKFCHYLKRKLNFIFFPYFLLKIKKAPPKNLGELVDFAFNRCFRLIRPAQIPEEILELLKILKEKKPKTILEIGTATGGTLFLFSRIACEDATIISIDLPGGKFGGGYPKWKIPLYNAFKLPKQKLYLIRADSHHPSTLKKVKEILGKRRIDFLFIDGDHTYEGVEKDFEMYSKLVGKENNNFARTTISSICSKSLRRKVLEGNNFIKKSHLGWNENNSHLNKMGIIVFHDIVPGPKENVGGVPEFWKKIKKSYPNHKEIINDWNQKGYGLGVIFI